MEPIYGWDWGALEPRICSQTYKSDAPCSQFTQGSQGNLYQPKFPEIDVSM